MNDQALADKRRDPRKALLRDQSFRAILKTWTPKMIEVGNKISTLPAQVDDPMKGWGFVFALDALRHRAPAIQALLEVVAELKHRPQREEVFAMVDRLLAFKVETKTSLKNHAAFQANQKTTGKVRFVRRN